MSYSREEKDIFGNTYIQHYNDDGTKSGWDTQENDILGNEYTQHHNQDYTKSGWSTPEKDILGNEYSQHHSQDYTKAGWSTQEKDILGNEYTQHHDQDYTKTGWSTPEKDILGNEYTQHRNQDYSSAEGVRHGHTHTSRTETGLGTRKDNSGGRSASGAYHNGIAQSVSHGGAFTASSPTSNGAGFIFFILIVMFGLIIFGFMKITPNPESTSAREPAQDPGEVIRKFGLNGTYSNDCSVARGQADRTVIWKTDPGQLPTVVAVSKAGSEVHGSIIAASIISQNRLRNEYTMQNAQHVSEIEKIGDGYRAISDTINGRPWIQNGILLANQREMPVLHRCHPG
jgi:hypothetical protein